MSGTSIRCRRGAPGFARSAGLAVAPVIVVSSMMMMSAITMSASAASAAFAAQQAERPGDTVTLDFQDADIRAVISALAELMGANVTYGALPQRTVTLTTHRPVPRDSLRPILMGLLEANGLTAVEEAGVIRVTADEEAAPRRRVGRPEPGRAVAQPVELYVIRLRHAHAAEVASILNSLFGGGPGAFGARPSLGAGRLSERLRGDLLPPAVPLEEPDQYPERPQGAATGAERGAVLTGAVSIVPDASTNSLLIRASAEDFEVIRQAVDQLDVRPLQVLIEVMIAEIRRDALTELGLEVLVPDQNVEGDLRAGGELRERTLGNVVVRIMQLGGAEIDALFEALSTSSDVTILSRPVTVTANNQEAHILVGSERPFIQVTRALPTESAVRDQIVQFRDVGTKLTVIPTINPDGYVSLSLVQEISAATAETQFGAPVISTRETATQLLVRDRQTVVIGGLIDHQRERTRSGVPLLKDLPILGALFGSTSWRTIETELFLFLTPRVMTSDEDVDRTTNDVRRAVPALQEELAEPLVGRDDAPADTVPAPEPEP